MKLDKSSVRPLYLQLEEILRRQIESGALKPGDRLPPENDLATLYDISRMTARRATNALVTEGVLVRHPGKGTFVAEEKASFSATSLTSFSGVMRGMGLAVSSQVLDLARIAAPNKIAGDLNLSPGDSVALLRRLRFVNGEAVALMSSWMPERYWPALQQADLTVEPITRVMEAASGLKIVKAEDYLEASLARPDEAELLGVERGAPVFVGRGVLYDAIGDPARSSKVIYRGDRFRINVSASSASGAEIRLPQTDDHAASEDSQWLALSFDIAE